MLLLLACVSRRLFRIFTAKLAGWGLGFLLAVCPVLVLAQGASAPQTAGSTAKKAADKPAAGASSARTASKPSWNELTPRQQQALKPLAASWNFMDEPRKRKWLAISQNYPKLSPAEQVKVQERMTEWTALSAQQRTQARLSYAETKELTAEQKEERWQAYQALSAEQKRALAKDAFKTPTGAAAAVTPVPAHKLAVTPSVRPASSAINPLPPKPNGHHVLGTASAPRVNRNTLLPRPAASAASGVQRP